MSFSSSWAPRSLTKDNLNRFIVIFISVIGIVMFLFIQYDCLEFFWVNYHLIVDEPITLQQRLKVVRSNNDTPSTNWIHIFCLFTIID